MNYFPVYVPGDGLIGARILFCGEAPGETETTERKPFVGASGMLFAGCLERNGISREECYITNLCHHQPIGNKFELLLKEDIFKEGLKELYSYIEQYRPTVIGALGGWPLKFLTGRSGITKWRGSILSYINDESIKVIPTLHPAHVLRDRGTYPIFDADIKRIIGDSFFREKRLPQRRFICDPRGLDLEEWTQRLCQAEYLGTDIETIKNSSRILCVGFAPSPELAVCINAEHDDGRRAIQRILLSNTKKIFQYGTFDTIQLLFLNGYEIKDPEAESLDRPYFWDTFIAQHTLAPELPRSLEYLTSVYTREPYYKTVGRASIPDDTKGWSAKVERQTLWEYNCRDCACTIEIALEQMKELEEESQDMRDIFQFDMEMLTVSREISCAGMLVDDERRGIIEEVLLKKWGTKQFALDRLTGYETNVRSPVLKKILYEKLGLPERKKKDHKTGKYVTTTDEDAIVSLIGYCKDRKDSLVRPDKIMEWHIKLVICQTILEIRGIRQVLSNYIRTHSNKKSVDWPNGIPRISKDGRLRSTYSAGPETGRWSASKFVDGTGLNAQTLPRDLVEIPESALLKPLPSKELISQLDDEPEEEETLEEEEVA